MNKKPFFTTKTRIFLFYLSLFIVWGLTRSWYYNLLNWDMSIFSFNFIQWIFLTFVLVFIPSTLGELTGIIIQGFLIFFLAYKIVKRY